VSGNVARKIVFINDRIHAYAAGDPSAAGGAERQQWLLARALAASGWSVVVGARTGLPAGARNGIDGVEFAGIGQGAILSDWHRFLSSERPSWWYWRCASHLWGLAVEVARLAGVRTIFAAGFDRDVRPRQALGERERRWWPLYAWGLARCDRIFVQHGGQLSDLAPRWHPKASVVRSIAPPVAAAKTHLERGTYVAWIAMLRQAKRPDLLVEIARQAPHLQFVVCGRPSAHRSAPGYGEGIVRALRALPNVDYRGQVPPEEAMRLISDAAVLLSTADEEGFPNTFLQAWSSGTPVVTLTIDPDGLIEHQGLGVASLTVPRAIAEISALVGSPPRREEIAACARRYVADAHSESAVVGVFEVAIGGVPAHGEGGP